MECHFKKPSLRKEKLTFIKMLPVIAFLLFVAVSAETGDDVDCTLAPETGLCQAYFPSYFFNSTSGQCEQFVYGGCQGNSNRFQSKRQCEVVCRPQDAVDCNADPETGMCQAIIPRFFYDRVTGECKSFVYGGCGGNTNNFQTFDDCSKQCGAVPPRVGPDCSSPAETGLCRAYFPRFFFNSKSGRCEKFIYGGCGGNDNSYDTEAACQKSCGGPKEDHEVDCYAEAESGPCDAYMPSFHYESATGTCQKFIYGGCGGNTNRFNTFAQCFEKCHVPEKRSIEEEVDCDAEPDTGFCRASFPMFAFNRDTGSCEEFIYGGCGGNSNRFGSEEDCLNRCQVKKSKKEEVDCDAEPETGFCRANFPMFAFNRDTGSCEEFIYGGCGGNSNRFGSEEDCLNRCQVKKSKKDLDCESEPETGFCRGYMPSFYFDKSTGTCERFIYGGCGGNANRFESQEDCLSACA